MLLFLTNLAYLNALYKRLEIDFREVTAYLLYRFPKG